MTRYSICITHYDNGDTLERSLKSITSQIDENFEIVIVDNQSTDGSQKILEKYAADGIIRLITKKCTRGAGRQLAFESSVGDYVISNLDMDDIFQMEIGNLIQTYHLGCEGYLLLASTPDMPGWGSNATIAPRELLRLLGGWRDLQYYEDWDLWSRAAQQGKFKWTDFALVSKTGQNQVRKSLVRNFTFRYGRYRDMIRLEKRIFADGEDVSISQRLVQIVSRLGALLQPLASENFNRDFDPFDPKYALLERDATSRVRR